MLTDINLLKNLLNYPRDDITAPIITELDKHLANPDFNKDMTKISEVADKLCLWVKAMRKYYDVNCIVKPKRAKLEEAQAEYKVIMDKLAIKQAELKAVNDKV